jgi:hypothetical protein
MLRTLSIAAAALVLSGCAALNNLNSDVSSYGPWPAERKPSTFVFERLPSQIALGQAQGAALGGRQEQLETAARGALEAAGFRAAADPADADYLMQVGARVTNNDPWVFNDPLFWRGGFRYGFSGYGGRWGRGWGPGFGPGWGYGSLYESSNFEREVALLIRDRKTGQLLYETRASNSGPSPSIDALLPAMFEAAMNGFPNAGQNPRTVTTLISRP